MDTARTRHQERKWLQRGFTLIEAIVTIAVISIFAGILFTGVVHARRNAAVRDAAQQFAGHLREAASLAKNGMRHSACEAEVDPEYGGKCSQYHVIWYDDGTYYIFTVWFPAGSYVQKYWIKSTYELPGGVTFSTGGGLKFESDFPVLTVTNAGRVELKYDALHKMCVEVSDIGVIDVEVGPCL